MENERPQGLQAPVWMVGEGCPANVARHSGLPRCTGGCGDINFCKFLH